MFERPKSGERAVLVHLDLDSPPPCGSFDAFEEFLELVISAGAQPVATVRGRRKVPDPRYFVGSGKANELKDIVERENAALVIADHELSPSQERNLEALLKCRVLDRTGLILDIFAQRARSFEGKLQVELAQLQHLSTRLIRGWTHLERQKGGIGLRGPGETQLETDRRLLGGRIKQIHRRLGKVSRQREQGRQARRKQATPSVSLVGYTNAGKSTLFNTLTEADSFAADQLFATLDPTLKRLELPNTEAVVIADTVGFISRLPTELVAAFRATLREIAEASLLLHVIDASDPEREFQAGQVDSVLAEIDADRVPRLLVYNKIDRIDGSMPRVDRDSNGQALAVWLSAHSGAGLDLLRGAIAERLRGETVHGWVRLPPAQAKLRARLFSLKAVLNERLNNDGDWLLEVRTSRKNLNRLCQREGLRTEWLESVS